MNKKVLKTLGVRKRLYSERQPLFSEHKPNINGVKITLELTKK